MCDGIGAGIVFPYTKNWNGKEYQYIGCKECRTAFVNPIPSESDFTVMYTKENYHDAYYSKIDLEPNSRSISKIAEYCNEYHSMLDFGCGNGSFLLAARQAGFICNGIEYSENVRRMALENSGIPVYSYNDLKASGHKFDIIHMGDVIEHIPEPKALIKELCELLSPKGIFFVEGPLENNPSLVYLCAASFKALRRKLKIDRSNTGAPTHLFITNSEAVKFFFTKSLGFHCLYFEVYENGWPYLLKDNISLSPGGLIKYIIGVLAIILSKIDIRNNRIFGNRFIGLFQPSYHII